MNVLPIFHLTIITVKDLAKAVVNSHIVVASKGYSVINSTCGTTERNITGSFLIAFHNCTVTVNETKFTNVEMMRSEKPIILYGTSGAADSTADSSNESEG